MRIRFFLLILLFLIVLVEISCTSTSKNLKEEYSLVWQDEFNYTGYPDSSKWDYDIGNGCPGLCGWGNNELQYYTRKSLDNARVDEGILTIEMQKEPIENYNYSSARLVTRGRQDWQYGRFEIRAKLPQSNGVWSALWMLPTDPSLYGSWPDCGEMDIMENVGFEPETIFASVHTATLNFLKGTQKSTTFNVPDNSDEFHTYMLEWDEEEITVLVDDEPYFSLKNDHQGYKNWPFDQPMYLLLNIAYGGNWGGMKGLEPDKLPQKMEIDYVRVYQKVPN